MADRFLEWMLEKRLSYLDLVAVIVTVGLIRMIF